MSKGRSLPLFVFLSLANSALAQLKVMTPEWLVSKLPDRGRVDGSTATFGAPYYGDRVLGQIVWGDSLKGKAHCTDDDYDIPPPPEHTSLRAESKRVSLINIVMVRRGQCSFVTKVKVAAQKGAHAVLIVDREDSALTGGELHDNVIVADDGYGDQIHIPSVLISKEDGAKLIDAVKRSKVVVELAWEVPVNHVVDVDMWMSSASAKSMDFVKAFAEKRKTLKKVVSFTPHYTVFSMDSSDPGVYSDLCLDTTGEFCAEDPDGSGLVTGREVLQENVRQLCIHEMTKVQHAAEQHQADSTVAYAQKFWDYVERLPDRCPLDGKTEEDRFGEVCSKKLMHSVGLNEDDVQSCVATTLREKLQHDRVEALGTGVVASRTVFVRGAVGGGRHALGALRRLRSLVHERRERPDQLPAGALRHVFARHAREPLPRQRVAQRGRELRGHCNRRRGDADGPERALLQLRLRGCGGAARGAAGLQGSSAAVPPRRREHDGRDRIVPRGSSSDRPSVGASDRPSVLAADRTTPAAVLFGYDGAVLVMRGGYLG